MHIPEKKRSLLFLVLLVAKTIFATSQTVLGFLLLFPQKSTIISILGYYAKEEILEDPKDYIARKITEYAVHFLINTQLFIALYLITHGLIKLMLLYGVYKQKLFVYPLAGGVFLAFAIYQIYEYIRTLSLGYLFLVILDFVFIALMIYEYKTLTKAKSI